MKKLFYLLFSVVVFNIAYSQEFSAYEKKEFSNAVGSLPYRILYPENYTPNKTYPLIVFLHGSGERGNDNEAQLKHGGSMFLRDSIRKKYPAIVIFPQCPADSFWTPVVWHWDSVLNKRVFDYVPGTPATALVLVKDLITQMITSKKADAKRIYLGGLSLGGFGSFAFAASYPKLLAAAFPICGGGSTTITNSYNKKVAWWLFHGDKDGVIPVSFSRDLFKKMQSKHLSVKYTEYPGVEHNSWENMFMEKEFFAWLFSKKR